MRRAALLLAAALPLAAAAAEHAFTLEAGDGKRERPVLRVARDDTVVLTLTARSAGEAHVHGYRLAAAVKPGTPATLRFTAHATGRYRVEWHAAGETGSNHHGPPLATLEVMPK